LALKGVAVDGWMAGGRKPALRGECIRMFAGISFAFACIISRKATRPLAQSLALLQ
jgi:hypothetical protein